MADVLLYAVYPSKRSIASAINILIGHLLGDASSPYVIGAVSFLELCLNDRFFQTRTRIICDGILRLAMH